MLNRTAVSVVAILVLSIAVGAVANGPGANAQEANGLLAQLLVKSIVLSPAKPDVGEIVDVDVEISNVGATKATDFFVDFYQDLPGGPILDEVGTFFCAIASLGAESSTICSGVVIYSATGSFDAWAQVDTEDEVSEEQENDNIFGPQKVDVNADVDLIVTAIDLDPAKPTAGEPVDVEVEVRNFGTTGAGFFFVDFYQDRAGPPPLFAVGDMSCGIPALAAGASAICSGTVTYASPGSFHAWAQVDTNDFVSETNEGNNLDSPDKVEVNAATPTPQPATATPTSTPVTPTSTPVTPTNTPVTPVAGVVGDADCSGFVDALDPLFILQFGAGLLGALPCLLEADANLSGGVDAIDATLILQFIAGLIGSLPP